MGILRTLLAFVVLFGHSAETKFSILGNDGGLAVLSFYVISGFYMSLITEKYRLQELSYDNIKAFYLSRFWRLFPIFWICTALTILFTGLLSLPVEHTLFDAFTQLKLWRDKFFYITENIFIFGQGLGRFLTFDTSTQHFVLDPLQKISTHASLVGSGFPLVGQAWTLSLELTFYLLVPFLLTRKNKFIFIIFSFSFFLNFFFRLNGWNNYNITHAFFPIVLCFFLLGSLSHRIIYERIKNGFVFLKPFAISSLVLNLSFMFFFYKKIQPNIVREYVFIFLVSLTIPFLFAYFKDSRFDKWIGELSFPVYMLHMLLIAFFTKYPMGSPGFSVGITSFFGALLLIYGVIRPIDNFRHRSYLRSQSKNLDLKKTSALSPEKIALQDAQEKIAV